MSLRADITIERFGQSGRRLQRRVFPSRSFLFGLIQMLYMQHAYQNLTDTFLHILFYTNSSGNWDGTYASYGQNLQVSSPGGRGGSYMSLTATLGDEIGIQLGTGSAALNSADRALDKRIAPIEGRVLRALKHPGSGTPKGLAWDGTYIWVVDQYSTPSVIYKINRNTGAVVAQFDAPGDYYSYNRGLTFDGTDLWCTGRDLGQSPVYRVFRISAVDGTVLQQWGAPGGNPANGLTWDGTYIWVAEEGGTYQLHQCVPTTGAINASINNPWGTSVPCYGLAYDGTYLWVVGSNGYSWGGKMIAKITTAGVLQKELFTPMGGYSGHGAQPWGLTWEDPYLWLSDGGDYTKAILQLCANKVRFDYAGCEVVDDESYVNPNGSFTVRRYFTNKSGGSITINEVGIYALDKEIAIARDLVSPGVAVANNETLKIEYTFQITV